jgi:hypothetical protein
LLQSLSLLLLVLQAAHVCEVLNLGLYGVILVLEGVITTRGAPLVHGLVILPVPAAQAWLAGWHCRTWVALYALLY